MSYSCKTHFCNVFHFVRVPKKNRINISIFIFQTSMAKPEVKEPEPIKKPEPAKKTEPAKKVEPKSSSAAPESKPTEPTKKPEIKTPAPDTPKIEVIREKTPEQRKTSVPGSAGSSRRGSLIIPTEDLKSRRPSLLISDEVSLLFHLTHVLYTYIYLDGKGTGKKCTHFVLQLRNE